jgi:hypothetical protein
MEYVIVDIGPDERDAIGWPKDGVYVARGATRSHMSWTQDVHFARRWDTEADAAQWAINSGLVSGAVSVREVNV